MVSEGCGPRLRRCPVRTRLSYKNGQGVPQDFAEAAKWYRLSADQGYALAQSNLGLMYAKGQGVPQDLVLAYMSFSLSACPPSALVGQIRQIEEGSVSGSS